LHFGKLWPLAPWNVQYFSSFDSSITSTSSFKTLWSRSSVASSSFRVLSNVGVTFEWLRSIDSFSIIRARLEPIFLWLPYFPEVFIY
jgi:hypothetical protein